jgi:methanogenic corrinoid protein MtbC1
MPTPTTLVHTDPWTLENEDQNSQRNTAWRSNDPKPNPSETPSDQSTILALLAKMVEGDIIPRLMLAHRTHAEPGTQAPMRPTLDQSGVEELARKILIQEVDELEAVMLAYLQSGTRLDEIYVDLMAPAARLLGSMWENDTASFSEVTIGLGRMHTLLARLSDACRQDYAERTDVASGLFVTPVGELHSFGIRMVDELFAHAGWRTLCEPNAPIQDVLDIVRSEAFHILGIGISSAVQVPFVTELISKVRKVSSNPNIQIMVGGSYIIKRPDLTACMGADCSAMDGREAIAIAETLLYEHNKYKLRCQ